MASASSSSSSSLSLTLKSLVGVEDAIKNMTPEQEIERYGPWDDFVSTILNEWGNEFSFPPVDLVWKGWDAAYIKSKGLNVCQGATLESTGLMDAIGERLKQKEFAITLLATVGTCSFYGWDDLESVREFDGRGLRQRVFDCIVKFILTIFDEEDFYRISHQHKIKEEHMKFCYKNAYSQVPVDLSPDKLSYLSEPDLYFALQEIEEYRAMAAKGDKKRMKFDEVCAYNDNYMAWQEYRSFRDSDVSRTLELMRNYRPLKGELQAQLILEISHEKCFHVADTLTLEAINGMDLPNYDTAQNFVWKDYVGQYRPDPLNTLIDAVVCGLENLSRIKFYESPRTEEAIIDVLAKKFGPFKDEVSEVIKRANHERRLGKCRFIELAHIWVALSFSRVCDMLEYIKHHHLKENRYFLLDGTSELYTFRLFKLSHMLASRLGHLEVGLEHLVYSIVYGSSVGMLMGSIEIETGRDLFFGLEKCTSDSRLVESWRNIDILTTIFENRCRLGVRKVCLENDPAKKLQESLKLGRLVLPKYEELRVV